MTIDREIDVLLCLGLLTINHLVNKQYSDIYERHFVTIPTILLCLRLGDAKEDISCAFSYGALVNFLKNISYYYWSNNSEGYMGIACSHFIICFGDRFLIELLGTHHYDKRILRSLASSAIETSAIIVQDLIGSKGIVGSFIRTLISTKITESALKYLT